MTGLQVEAFMSICFSYAFLSTVYIGKERTVSYASTSACRLYYKPCDFECIELEYC